MTITITATATIPAHPPRVSPPSPQHANRHRPGRRVRQVSAETSQNEQIVNVPSPPLAGRSLCPGFHWHHQTGGPATIISRRTSWCCMSGSVPDLDEGERRGGRPSAPAVHRDRLLTPGSGGLAHCGRSARSRVAAQRAAAGTARPSAGSPPPCPGHPSRQRGRALPGRHRDRGPAGLPRQRARDAGWAVGRAWPYYLPGNCVPHCTLAEGLDKAQAAKAFGLLLGYEPSRRQSRRPGSRTPGRERSHC